MEVVKKNYGSVKITVKAAGLDERILKLFGEIIEIGQKGEVIFQYAGDLNILTQILSQYSLELLLIEEV